MLTRCPVCLNAIDPAKERDYGERIKCVCGRCGTFEITRTAHTMLEARAEKDEFSRARLSHAIRALATTEAIPSVSSTNLDELLNRPLPGIDEQLSNLIHWVAAQLRDDRLGRIKVLPAAENMAAVIGAVDAARVSRLIEYAHKGENVIVLDDDGVGLSPKGWGIIDRHAKTTKIEEKNAHRDAPHQPATTETVRAHCERCNGSTKSFIRATHTVNGGEGHISWSNTYSILECCGCEKISVQHEHWFSEWDEISVDPLTGDERLIPGVETKYWPAPTKRRMPDWVEKLEDKTLKSTFDEVYQALNAGLVVLSTLGTRTVLDRAMHLRVGDPKGGFSEKLQLMQEKGHIGKDEIGILSIVTDAGSASAHRGFAPSAATLITIIEAVENFLQREFILKAAIQEVKEETPRRDGKPTPPRKDA